MRIYDVEAAPLLAALNCGQAHEILRALYGSKTPQRVKVVLLCRDANAHFEFMGTRRIFRLPSDIFSRIAPASRV